MVCFRAVTIVITTKCNTVHPPSNAMMMIILCAYYFE